jgi:multidrug resistance efflux pump
LPVAAIFKAGETIAWLDRSSAQIQVSQLQAGLVAAQARLETIRGGARTEDVASAQASLAQQQPKLDNLRSGGRAEDIKIAEAGLSAANAKMGLRGLPVVASEEAILDSAAQYKQMDVLASRERERRVRPRPAAKVVRLVVVASAHAV